jgi:hypothetical protein
MDKLFELLGLGTPLIYAGATYGFFVGIDANVSDEARTELARLVSVKDYEPTTVSAGIVQIFDRVYTYPLFAWRAFLRSALITLLLSIIYIYEFVQLSVLDPIYFVHSFFANIISDYLSLYIIRAWLVRAAHRPIAALLLCSLIWFVVIALSFIFRVIGITLAFWVLDPQSPVFDIHEVSRLVVFRHSNNPLFDPIFLLMPALFVFIWLPLFGVSLLIIRLINMLAVTVGKVQWFLKGGEAEPLRAVGYVAGFIVFAGTVLWNFLRAAHSVVQHALDCGAWFISAFT